MARILATGSCLARPWKVTSCTSWRGLFSTQVKYSTQAFHRDSASANLGAGPDEARAFQASLPGRKCPVRASRS
jgi:hypothetical protein